MVEDVVKELGYLSLGTRLKRIGETLQAQTQAVLALHGFEQPAAWFPLLAALDRLGPLSVGELSQAVGVSQPVVTRSLRGLEDDGLVQSEVSEGDRRVRRRRQRSARPTGSIRAAACPSPASPNSRAWQCLAPARRLPTG